MARVTAEYPDAEIAQRTQSSERRSERIGKPIEFTFKDAINGRTISLQKDLRGKVVVIEFWSTQCGPCVAELPKLKGLYNEYKGMGVEFIGVSLDEASEEGRKAVRDFVQKNRIEWLQSHGEDADEFVSSWDITLIPTVFVVDTKGNLHSVEGRGRLDSLIPELLR
ncbi:TlpA disulfide reductase family protein [Singulisphaera sp. Ch08]|uniref:TlpA disulfide reductase family protein n=1 Tax=Singulisphaera sp. Ch08 TaxID=3120278 RepID=A0AAU7CSZ9_9BACT